MKYLAFIPLLFFCWGSTPLNAADGSGGPASVALARVTKEKNSTALREIVELPAVRDWLARKSSRRTALRNIQKEIQNLGSQLEEQLQPTPSEHPYRSLSLQPLTIEQLKEKLLLYFVADALVYRGDRRLLERSQSSASENKPYTKRDGYIINAGLFAPIGLVALFGGAYAADITILLISGGVGARVALIPTLRDKSPIDHFRARWINFLLLPTMTIPLHLARNASKVFELPSSAMSWLRGPLAERRMKRLVESLPTRCQRLLTE